MKEFQETVVEIIREVSPDVARGIIERLKARRALRPSGELQTLDGGTDAVVA